MIERQFDIRFVAGLALREKQIQQNYRPVIAVHKWFARRPGTLFRGLLLSEFGNSSLPEAFYKAHALSNVSVIDPFMGGGTTLLEANRLGCAITGMDVNPMSYWVVREEIETLDLGAYQKAAATIRTRLESKLGHLYRTSCVRCGSVQANVKYFLWVKTIACQHCAHAIDLFPNFLIAEDVRHVANVFVCRKCNQLFESESRKSPRPCPHCRTVVTAEFAARKGQCKCAGCGQVNRFPIGHGSAPTHRLFAIEYHCSNCKKTNKGRFFKMADHHDLAKMSEAGNELARIRPKFVPEDAIPNGIETERLHRWGYQHYRQMFNSRQLLGLEFLCREISAVSNVKLKRALSTNLSDLLRYQNMLCRYDSMALKSLDVFSIHGFPIGQIQCESNLLGIEGDGVVIGSGGLLNIIDKFAKAKAYCTRPFEIRHEGQRKIPVFIEGEWIGEERNGTVPLQRRSVNLSCADAMQVKLRPAEFDAVLTDPPYFGNVQYAELMDFCYVWLRRLAGDSEPAFSNPTTRHRNELTENASMGRGVEHFSEGLSQAFQNVSRALKAGGPFVFTYHHNRFPAYLPLALAILDSGLTCSGSIPCPAEMGASIHINGTNSSIVDTVFVCRTTGRVPRRWIVANPNALAELICAELDNLRWAGMTPTQGDIRCIIFGHLIRLAVWNLRENWDKKLDTARRLELVAQWVSAFGGPEGVQQAIEKLGVHAPARQHFEIQESITDYAIDKDEIPF